MKSATVAHVIKQTSEIIEMLIDDMQLEQADLTVSYEFGDDEHNVRYSFQTDHETAQLVQEAIETELANLVELDDADEKRDLPSLSILGVEDCIVSQRSSIEDADLEQDTFKDAIESLYVTYMRFVITYQAA